MSEVQTIKVLFVSSEAAPFAKTGGLADVAGALPKELAAQGADIRLVLPKYGSIPASYAQRMQYLGYIYVDVGYRHQYCGVFVLQWEGVQVYFLDNEYYFKREALYGFADEGERYAFFSRAVLEMLKLVDFQPDILHCNDWQTGPISLLLETAYRKESFYSRMRTVFTIHNMKFQGVFPKEALGDLLGLGWEHFTPEKIEFHDSINFMKAGLACADRITTVSPAYAGEIRSDFFGEGLQGVINRRAADVSGILNGIDTGVFDPSTDTKIFTNYSARDLRARHFNKRGLQKQLGLPADSGAPVIGIISRLTDQKGFDLIECVLEEILQEEVQIVVLGTGDVRYESMWLRAAQEYPEKVSANITFDVVLAQRVYAGTDMFLMPSLFEPCGLGQLYALRYGSVPVVRETGGLKDTVQSYNELTGEGNGFSFTNYNAHDMLYTIRRAISFYHDRKTWNTIIKNGMQQDFGWGRSAGEYMKLYRSILD